MNDTANDELRHDEHQSWVLPAVERHEAQLTHYAKRLTGDPHAARDVMQHVFLQLCDYPATIRLP